MKNAFKYIILIFFGSLALVSCEKVIDLDLKTSEPRIVIEGNILSDTGPYYVSVTSSGDYYTSEGIVPLNGAQIIITDDLEHSDTLIEVSDGIYQTQHLQSEYNRTYHLRVDYNNTIFEASEKLPEMISIDSLTVEKDEGGGPGGPQEGSYIVYCSFLDPIAQENYYRFVVYVNGERVNGSFFFYNLMSDELYNGQIVHRTLRVKEVKAGDQIKVELHHIGFNTYEYFRSLNDALSGGGGGSTPYNPITNLNNNALGYFGAYALDTDSLVINN